MNREDNKLGEFDEIKPDTKTHILDVAQALVQTVGANAMSYEHISKAVGIRKASIHYHFHTKENLIEALIMRYNECVFASIDSILSSDKTGSGKLIQYIALFEATLRDSDNEKACLIAMLGAEVQTMGGEISTQVKRFYTYNEERLATILEEGYTDKTLRYEGTPQEMARLIFSLLEGTVLVARGQGSISHFHRVSEQLLQMVKA